MPRFGSFTSARSMTTSSRSRVSYTPPLLTYYRGMTGYSSGYTLNNISSVPTLLRSSPVKFGSKSGDTGPYVNDSTYKNVVFPITSIGNQFWAEMWHYTPSQYTSIGESTRCFSVYNSSTLDNMVFMISYFSYSSTAIGVYRGNPGAIGGSTMNVATQQDTWNHLAWYVNGRFWTIYVNGTAWNGTSLLDNNNNGTTYDRVTLGDGPQGGQLDAGRRFYMDDFRLSAGLTRYSFASTITVPTAQLTADANTTLLVNF